MRPSHYGATWGISAVTPSVRLSDLFRPISLERDVKKLKFGGQIPLARAAERSKVHVSELHNA